MVVCRCKSDSVILSALLPTAVCAAEGPVVQESWGNDCCVCKWPWKQAASHQIAT